MEAKTELDILLEWLSPDRDKAERLYLDLRRRITFVFRTFEDSEDLAAEVMERALRNVKNERVDFTGEAVHYIYGIANLVKMEQFRKKKLIHFDDMIKEPSTESQKNSFPEDLYQIIEECLKELSTADKQLFLEYTFPPEGVSIKEYREQLANKHNKTVEHMRVKMFRLRDFLRICARKKLEDSL